MRDRYAQVTVFMMFLTGSLVFASVYGNGISDEGVTAYWAAVSVYVVKMMDRKRSDDP